MDEVLEQLAGVIESRKGADPSTSYTARLLNQDFDGTLKKVGEEAIEFVLAAKAGDAQHVVREAADLWFHTLVVLARLGLGPREVAAELQRRFGQSGLAEKAARIPSQAD